MKSPKILLFFLLLALNSCSSNDDNNSSVNNSSKFAMTARVDGVLWEMQNPFNSNFATRPVFNYYSETDFIQLAGRNGGTFGLDEIRLLIKRTDLKIGSYPITPLTYDGSKTEIETVFNSKANTQYLVDGTLSITALDLNAKTVKGTFSFNCVEDNSKPVSASNPITTRVTEGTFDYKYDFNY